MSEVAESDFDTEKRSGRRPVFSKLTRGVLRGNERGLDETPTDWIVDEWIARGNVGLIFGPPKRGKSTTTFDLAVSLSTGKPWLGLIETKRCPVVMVDYENPESYAAESIDAAIQARGSDPRDARKMLHRLDRRQLIDCMSPFDSTAIVDVLDTAELESHLPFPGLLIVDSVRSAFGGLFDVPDWENNQDSIWQLMTPLRQLAQSTGWAVLMIHHSPKHGQTPAGTAAWAGMSDFIIKYERGERGPARIKWDGRSHSPPEAVKIDKPDGWITGYRGKRDVGRKIKISKTAQAVLRYVQSSDGVSMSGVRKGTFKTRTLGLATARKALGELVTMGLITTRQGMSGSKACDLFVAC